jgi:hypothetical protein
MENMSGPQQHTFAEIWPFLVLFIILAPTVGAKLMSIMSGWRSLASVYPEEHPFAGDLFRFQSVFMRYRSAYANVVIFGANQEGLRISVFLPWRFAHPPIFVPWQDVSAKAERRGTAKMMRLYFENSPEISMLIMQRLAAKLSRSSGDSFNLPTAI